MAEVTERAQIGALVICNSYRNPELLADAHRTIDHISGGRAILGIGAGWFERDYDEYGYEFGTAPDRLRALARRRCRGSRSASASSTRRRVGKLPILIGGSGPKVDAEARRPVRATCGTASATPRRTSARTRSCSSTARDVGRDPAEIERTWGIQADDLDNADALVEAGVQHLIVGIGGDGSGYDLRPARAGGLARLLKWCAAHGVTP